MTDSYDEVSYPSSAKPQTHPDRLATLGKLFGMNPAPPESCRVLELGCGDGDNLVSMAFGLPGSTFTGVELAAAPCKEAERLVRELGLGNVTLRRMNLMDVGRGFGEFDYIIAHGVYSWVPDKVRDKILAIAQEHLAPHGIAYLSYNTFPGGHVRRMIREMLLYHVRELDDPQERLSAASELLKNLAASENVTGEYRTLIRKECERVLACVPGHFYHDDLAEFNEPVHLWQFVEHARRHGLQYLCEADLHQMQASLQVDDDAGASEDAIVRKEQYGDFFRCRKFRQTLLCRARVRLERGLDSRKLTGFIVASPAHAASGPPDLGPDRPEEFLVERSGEEGHFRTDHPLGKAALAELGETWPRPLRFTELLERARDRIRRSAVRWDALPAEDEHRLASFILRLYAANMVELGVRVPEFVLDVSERPAASLLARIQLRTQNHTVNLRHKMMEVDDNATRQLIMLLDGSRDRATLRNELEAKLGTEVSEEALERTLASIASALLLTA